MAQQEQNLLLEHKMQFTPQHLEQAKYVADGITFGAVVSTLLGWLPPIAALMSAIWIGLQIYWGVKDRRKRNG